MSQINKLESPDKIYFSFLKNNDFKVQKCNSCNEYIFFPRLNCNHCFSDDYCWESPSKYGEIYAFTYMPIKDSATTRNAILVDMDDGFRVLSTLVGIGENLVIGAKVKAQVETGVAGARLVFKLANQEQQYGVE